MDIYLPERSPVTKNNFLNLPTNDMLRWLAKDDICDKVRIVVNECSREESQTMLSSGTRADL